MAKLSNSLTFRLFAELEWTLKNIFLPLKQRAPKNKRDKIRKFVDNNERTGRGLVYSVPISVFTTGGLGHIW